MTDPLSPLTVAGLFAGIGGIELGFQRAGHRTNLLCEIDEPAQAVLRHHFPGVELASDVAELERLPGGTQLVAGGFPCQDLSQAGRTAGIGGSRSGLVDHVFRLVEDGPDSLEWLLLENVPFMLQLDRGEAMRYLVERLEDLGFRWAYRVVDARSFGLPQRRQRVILLASRTHDPRRVLFVDDAGEPTRRPRRSVARGFYWTEGLRGLGWAEDAVPTLKGGSSVGIPSPPAVWMPDGSIVTPHVRDAERLQGFPAGWTEPAVEDTSRRSGPRWKLVGNAVPVPLAAWVGERLREPGEYIGEDDEIMDLDLGRWPRAAWGEAGKARRAAVSGWPVTARHERLDTFLRYPTEPLSARAAAGFLKRAERSSLRFEDGFLDDVRRHLDAMGGYPKG